MTAETLRRMSREELEQLYVTSIPSSTPRGRFRGGVLCRLESRAAEQWRWRLVTRFLFELPPFGIDFERSEWFFGSPVLGVGRFTPRIAPSRWRDTQTVALEYHVSALPDPIRRLLYDEVKPLGHSLCLGLGGINAPRGQGELFFFLLERG